MRLKVSELGLKPALPLRCPLFLAWFWLISSLELPPTHQQAQSFSPDLSPFHPLEGPLCCSVSHFVPPWRSSTSLTSQPQRCQHIPWAYWRIMHGKWDTDKGYQHPWEVITGTQLSLLRKQNHQLGSRNESASNSGAQETALIIFCLFRQWAYITLPYTGGKCHVNGFWKLNEMTKFTHLTHPPTLSTCHCLWDPDRNRKLGQQRWLLLLQFKML